MVEFARKSFGAAICWAVLLSAEARPAGRRTLPMHVPAAVSRLQPLADLPETHRLNLALGLPLRHRDALNRLLHDLYDPASPRYRHFLKPNEFADAFSPSEADYQRLIAFARARHWQILRTHDNRVLLDVAASAAQAEDVFHVHMKVYQHPAEARTFYAPDAAPSIPLDVPLLSVNGLDNFALAQPVFKSGAHRGEGGGTQTGSGPGGAYLGHDFRAAYAPGVTLDGAGQSVALVEFDTYYTNDILAYQKLAGITPVAITNVIVDGFRGKPGSGDVEVSIDIEMAIAMAPGLSQVLVYEAPYDYSSVNNDLLNQIAVDDLANQISCSWFFLIDAVTDQIFQQMAAQGQTFFNANGDTGAYYAEMAGKEGDPYITQVGGSVLTTSGAGGTWQAEQAWSPGSGGISAIDPIPYWQQSVNMSANGGSAVWRNVPDVALCAQGNLATYANGVTNGLSGTSCAAPLWAGFMALVNQQAAQNGQPPVGFLNPAIYALGQSGLYRSCFHDITNGGNRNVGSPTKFLAKPGYDLCTGWGTPAGQALIDALAPPDSLVILPTGGLSLVLTNDSAAAGELETLVLTNGGASAITWSLAEAPAWIQFSATNGVVPPDAAASLTVTTSLSATNLPVGGYAVDLILSNSTSGVAHDIPIFLAVSDPLIVTPETGMDVTGPVGGPFSMTSQLISLSNAGVGPLPWTVHSGSPYLSVAPGGGTLAPGQTSSITATLAPAVSNLLISANIGSISLADLFTGYTRNLPFTLAVGNGGFETGDFSDWVFSGSSNADYVGGAPLYLEYVHSGAFAAVLGEPSMLGTLAQTLPTAAGQPYLISFWLDNPVGGTPNEIEVAWNGNTLFAQTNMPKFSWANMQYMANASSNLTVLEFFFQNLPDAFGLDDVSVTALAPTAFTSVVITNGALQFDWSAMAGFSYQLQYTTNLLQPFWTNFGRAIVATGPNVAATNLITPDPQGFYRVVLLPP